MRQSNNRSERGRVGTADGRSSGFRHRLGPIFAFCHYALHRFNQDGCFAASGALSYTTLVSLVPLGVVGFSVLAAFPIFGATQQQLLALLFGNFVPAIGDQAAWWFQRFAASATQATAIGLIGIAATGVLLLVTVEDQLNALWRVTASRRWLQRIPAYWTLITLGPLLVGMSLTLSAYLDIAARHVGLNPAILDKLAAGWPHVIAHVLPFVSEVAACTLLYCLIPNCTVRWRDGLVGAAIAAAAIELLKVGFVFYIGASSFYQTIYGTLAAIPIFLLWMYVTWAAVLLGAVVAANLPTWRVDERFAQLSSGGVRLGFALALLAVLERAQRHGERCAIAMLVRELGAPASVVDKNLHVLAKAGFTAPTQDRSWVLAWDPQSATLHDLYEALGLPLAGHWLDRPFAPWQRQVAPAMERIVKAEAAATRETLASLLAEIRRPAALVSMRPIAENSASE